jgi:hypothetical protein
MIYVSIPLIDLIYLLYRAIKIFPCDYSNTVSSFENQLWSPSHPEDTSNNLVIKSVAHAELQVNTSNYN